MYQNKKHPYRGHCGGIIQMARIVDFGSTYESSRLSAPTMLRIKVLSSVRSVYIFLYVLSHGICRTSG